MVNIDERFNIIKGSQDWQMMKLELFNVNIDKVENVIIKVYNDGFTHKKECRKFYEEDKCIKVFFLLDDTIPKGEYQYIITVTFKSKRTIDVISERGYSVSD